MQLTLEDCLVMMSRSITQANAGLSLALSAWAFEEDIPETKVAQLEEELSFSPTKGNVIFASSNSNWAFTLEDFAPILSKVLGGANPDKAKAFLWGDFYLSKEKKILKAPQVEGQQNIFTQVVLKNIQSIYTAVCLDKDAAKVQKITSVLNLDISASVMSKLESEPTIVVTSILNKWLPLTNAVNRIVFNYFLSPAKSQALRLDSICRVFQKLRGNKEKFQKILPYKESLERCSPQGHLIAYISKVIFVPNKNINEKSALGNVSFTSKGAAARLDQSITAGNFFAFTRVFSGTIKVGQTIYMLLSKEKDEAGDDRVRTVEIKVTKLFIWMGYHLDPVQEVGPGSICALPDLGEHSIRFATISDSPECPLLNKIKFGSNLIKVSIRAKELSQMGLLNEGLKILKKVDPAVDTYYDEQGDIILETSGEVHLERCVHDLENEFAKVELSVSEPIVSFKETIISKNIRKLNTTKTKKAIMKEVKHANKKAFAEDNKAQKDGAENGEDSPSKKGKVKGGDPLDGAKEGENGLTMQAPGTEEHMVCAEPGPADADAKKYRFHTESSSFFESTSEEEPEQDTKADDAWLYEDDPNQGKEDATDIRYIYRESNFVYQKKRIEEGKVVRKGVNMKIHAQEFLSLQRKKNYCEVLTQNKKYKVLVRAVGLGQKAADFLAAATSKIKKLFSNGPNMRRTQDCLKFLKQFIAILEEEHEPDFVKYVIRYLVSFGPLKCGPNLLLSKLVEPAETLTYPVLQGQEEFSELFKKTNHQGFYSKTRPDYEQFYSGINYEELIKSCGQGFELALEKGPLCLEEMYGCVFIVEDFINLIDEELKCKRIKESILKDDKDKVASKHDKDDASEKSQAASKDQSKKAPDSEHQSQPQPGADLTSTENGKAHTDPGVKPSESTEDPKEEENMIDRMQHEEMSASKSKKPQSVLTDENIQVDPYGPLSAQFVSAVKKGCTNSFLGAEPRLVQGILLITVYVAESSLRAVNDALMIRRSKILETEYEPLTNLFFVKALMPIQESIGFFAAIMKLTSGKVSPQLEFSGWEMIEIDPFYQPKTKDEKEEHGEKFLQKNYPRLLIEKLRVKKGLATDKKIVADGDKQSTHSKTR